MSVFVDTSALYSAINAGDHNHQVAAARWAELVAGDEPLVTTNYVVVETTALLSRRLGFESVRAFQADMVPALSVHWVDQKLHQEALAALLTAGNRYLSLVDCVSFALMRRLEIDTAFAFDTHFVEQGFRGIA